MSEQTGIEWTDATWNPWHGCHKISPGCKDCYMFREKRRYGQDPNVVVRSKTKFADPLKWKEPRLIFTCSWSDWLIEEADPWREEAYDIIRRTPQHTYQILTKRIERAAGRVPNPPLPNVLLGVSVEDQQRADERIPLLLQTPAAVRFLSVEPLLGPLTLDADWLWPRCQYCWRHRDRKAERCSFRDCGMGGNKSPLIDWVIVGGESGPGARPMHPDWVRFIRDQCVDSDVPFFFKQWGEYAWHRTHLDADETPIRVGKKKAGRVLGGRVWDQMPDVRK